MSDLAWQQFSVWWLPVVVTALALLYYWRATMSWLTILITLLPLLLQLLAKLFPPKALDGLRPLQRQNLALAIGRMKKILEQAKEQGMDPDGKEVKEAMAADDE